MYGHSFFLFAQKTTSAIGMTTENSSGQSLGFPDVCFVPLPPAPQVPIPYSSISYVKSENKKSKSKVKLEKKSVTYTIKGEGLERIGSANVYVNGISSEMFEATLEPVARGAKNVSNRKITITAKKGPLYLSKMNLNFRRSLDSEPFFNDNLFASRANLVQKPKETADFRIISHGEN